MKGCGIIVNRVVLMNEFLILLLPLCFTIAFLYSSVGHGGASGYLALFALVGLIGPEVVTVVLTLNIVVSGTSFINYYRHGYFEHRMLTPLLLASLPAAFLGGLLSAPNTIYTIILGSALLFSALRLFFFAKGFEENQGDPRPLTYAAGLPLGALLGFLSGLIGIGGGVFLSPLLLFLRRGSPKHIAAVASAFVLLNSISGLAGHGVSGSFPATATVPLLVTVFAGGYLGSYAGSNRLPQIALNRVLGLVVFVASIKLFVQ
jgi:uncharacterized protein